MEIENYSPLSYDPGVIRWEYQTPIQELSPEERFEYGVKTTEAVLDSFKTLIEPTEVVIRVGEADSDASDDSPVECTVTDSDGLTPSAVVGALRDAANDVVSPRFLNIEISPRVRFTFADGIHAIGRADESEYVHHSDFREDDQDIEFHTPLEIGITESSVMKPCPTSVIRIESNTAHWFSEGPNNHTNNKTALAQINQRRLAGSLSAVYDKCEPQVASIETTEDSEGYRRGPGQLPSVLRFSEQHSIEWVLRSFEQHKSTDTGLKFRYIGPEPLLPECNPEEKIAKYLQLTQLPSKFKSLETITVELPDRDLQAEWYNNAISWIER